jgi:hypothetical protein
MGTFFRNPWGVLHFENETKLLKDLGVSNTNWESLDRASYSASASSQLKHQLAESENLPITEKIEKASLTNTLNSEYFYYLIDTLGTSKEYLVQKDNEIIILQLK